MQKRISKIVTIGSIGCVGFLLGSYVEKYNKNVTNNDRSNGQSCIFENLDVLKKSYFPSLGTVWASTAIVQKTPSKVSQIMQYGVPGMTNIISYSDYVLSYDNRNRVPHWVMEHLTPESVQKANDVDRSKCDFKEDTHVHEYFRSSNADYKASGFDRGHLAAAGNHRQEQRHCDETFFLSNIAPQVGVGFNRDIWNKLESYVRKIARKSPNTLICSGPLYLAKREADGKSYVRYQVIGKNSVAVPTHFFKIILYQSDDNNFMVESYIMPNQKIDNETPLKAFLVPINTIERHSGLIFFNNLSKSKIKSFNGKNI